MCVSRESEGGGLTQDHLHQYLDQVHFARADVVVQQAVEALVVAVSVSRAHGGARTSHALERPVLADTTKTAQPLRKRSSIALLPLTASGSKKF